MWQLLRLSMARIYLTKEVAPYFRAPFVGNTSRQPPPGVQRSSVHDTGFRFLRTEDDAAAWA